MFTVKEIANFIGVSKPTVQKVINENFIEADKIEKNKFRYYSYEKTVFIIRLLKPDFDFSILPKNTEKELKNTEKPQNIPQDPLETIEKSQSNEHTERLITLIEQQLNEKNRLLAQKDKEIQEIREKAEKERADLQDKLAAAYAQISEMAQKAQYITAADKTAQIMDKQSKEDSSSKDPIDPASYGSEATATLAHSQAKASSNASSEEDPPQRKGFFSKIFKK